MRHSLGKHHGIHRAKLVDQHKGHSLAEQQALFEAGRYRRWVSMETWPKRHRSTRAPHVIDRIPIYAN